MLNFSFLFLLTLIRFVTSNVLKKVTIGLGAFIQSSYAAARLVSFGLTSFGILSSFFWLKISIQMETVSYFVFAKSYASATHFSSSPSTSFSSPSTICVVHRPGYGSVLTATREDSNGYDIPSVTTRYGSGSSFFFFTRANDTQANI